MFDSKPIIFVTVRYSTVYRLVIHTFVSPLSEDIMLNPGYFPILINYLSVLIDFTLKFLRIN